MSLFLLRYRPLEPRRRIRRYLQLGDAFANLGEEALARQCYETSKSLAEEAGTVHLLKKAERRFF
ncbi:MAG TPA: hypothetical protein GX528_03800 [Firmicutes bacterium]|nr:hypothetical protein [Bacillota bacterium]